MFILGIITGILISILILLALVYFRKPIESKMQIIEKQVALKGPRPRGFLIEPESDAEQARQKIIEINRKMGRSTPISDLR